MYPISFTAGYGDPNRTIRQKYMDYATLNQLMDRLRAENYQLELRRSALQTRLDFLNTLPKVTSAQEAEIRNLTQEVNSINDTIERNNDTSRKAWYAYHERD